MISLRYLRLLSAAFGMVCLAPHVSPAQQQPRDVSSPSQIPRAKPERDKDKFNRLSPYFRSWVNEDVLYIISPEEREAFLDTKSDEERNQFIYWFWDSRNPNEGSNENLFEEEHYRRIVYANEHFGDQVQGWKSDRGRVYIMFGPPDAVTSVSAGRDCDNVAGPVYGVVHKSPAHETWKYRYVEGIGEDVDYDFVARVAPDQVADSSPPAYVLSVSPCSAPSYATPGMPQELMSKLLRRGDVGPPRTILSVATRQAALPQNRDLEGAVASHLVRTQLPLQLQFDSTPVTTITSLTTLKILVPADALFPPAAGEHGAANFKAYGQLENTVTGWIESWFECDTSPKPPQQTGQQTQWVIACEKPLIMPAGVYELRIAAKENVSQKYGMASATVAVPGYVAESPASGGR